MLGAHSPVRGLVFRQAAPDGERWVGNRDYKIFSIDIFANINSLKQLALIPF